MVLRAVKDASTRVLPRTGVAEIPETDGGAGLTHYPRMWVRFPPRWKTCKTLRKRAGVSAGLATGVHKNCPASEQRHRADCAGEDKGVCW